MAASALDRSLAVRRRKVNFKVAGKKDGARRRSNGHRICAGNGMIDAVKLHRKTAQLHDLPGFHGDGFDAIDVPLAQFVFNQRQRQSGTKMGAGA